MKKNVDAPVILLVILFIIFPLPVKKGALYATELTLKVLIPSLFPAIVLSKAIVHTKISSKGWFPVLFSVIAGIPATTMLLDSLYQESEIDLHRYKTMLILTSNTSLSFLINFVYDYTLDSAFPMYFLIMVFYIPPILNSLIYHYIIIGKNAVQNHNIPIGKSTISSEKMSANACFLQSAKSMVNIYCYVTIFSILFEFFKLLTDNSVILCGMSSFLEITTSCSRIHFISGNLLRIYITVFAICFGGICALFQINSVITDKKNITFVFLFKVKMLNAVTALSILKIILLF